ncbi:hypothetical protein SteCoe_19996 [Stentor coeruleus]|uniref:Uncharacterized protein n=1 Tax=Stentor coeruleus TaxID=5963 RepID=A0A1R2BSX8_9CILI|nr:hypothetical protein SteCoe_19996 [Stentor coeruleus]
MCCSRKKAEFNLFEAVNKIGTEPIPNNLEDLLEELPSQLLGIEELKKRKESLINLYALNAPNQRDITRFRDESGNLAKTMIEQINIMSKGLTAIIILNTEIEGKLKS